ncbi:MAG: DUF2244 domain-containing protein [Aquabacterium sp.]
MSATIASHHWLAGALRPAAAMVLGRRGDTAGAASWDLRRNCSITPRQLLRAYLGLCVLALTVAAGFLIGGAPLVIPFTLVELAAVGIALLAWARHASDAEVIQLDRRHLTVTHECAGVRTSVAFRAGWVRVEPMGDDRSLVELSGEGRRAQVGRYLQPHLRGVLAREIRHALRERAPGTD